MGPETVGITPTADETALLSSLDAILFVSVQLSPVIAGLLASESEEEKLKWQVPAGSSGGFDVAFVLRTLSAMPISTCEVSRLELDCEPSFCLFPIRLLRRGMPTRTHLR